MAKIGEVLKTIDDKFASMNGKYDNLETQINMDLNHIKENGDYVGNNGVGNGNVLTTRIRTSLRNHTA